MKESRKSVFLCDGLQYCNSLITHIYVISYNCSRGLGESQLLFITLLQLRNYSYGITVNYVIINVNYK